MISDSALFNFRHYAQPIDAYNSVGSIDYTGILPGSVKLAANENPFGCSRVVRDAFTKSLDNSHIYPDGRCAQLRKAVSNFYEISPEKLIFGAGVDELIFMLCKIFIDNKDEAIIGSATYPQYKIAVRALGGKIMYSPMKNYELDLSEVLQRITQRTKMIFLANPNNPTGTIITSLEQEKFLRQVPKNIVVIFDEAYQEYVISSDYPNTWETLQRYSNVVLLKTFSKIYGLASFRVGFCAAHPEIIKRMEKIRSPYNVSSQAQVAACAALGDQAFVETSKIQNQHAREMLVSALRGDCILSHANFIMVKVDDDMEVCKSLLRKGYVIRPGTDFGMSGFVRVSIGTQEHMKGFLSALQDIKN